MVGCCGSGRANFFRFLRNENFDRLSLNTLHVTLLLDCSLLQLSDSLLEFDDVLTFKLPFLNLIERESVDGLLLWTRLFHNDSILIDEKTLFMLCAYVDVHHFE